MVDLFATALVRDSLDRQLSLTEGPERVPLLVQLAWYLRQRDGARSRDLGREAGGLLESGSFRPDFRARHEGRCILVQAEDCWLRGQLEAAEAFLRRAEEIHGRIEDEVGLGDGHWLAASVWYDRGDQARSVQELQAATHRYRQAGDPVRQAAVVARRLANEAYRAPAAALQELERTFGPGSEPGPLLAPWISAVRATVAAMTGDMGQAIRYFTPAYQGGLDTGQIRLALVASGNASACFSRLGALDEALEWAETSARLVQGSGWPGLVGLAQTQVADVHLQLGRLDEARQLGRETLAQMAAEASSRNYANVLALLGEVALADRDWDEALHLYERYATRAEELGGIDLKLVAARGRASALVGLERYAEAAEFARRSLAQAQAQGDTEETIKALRLLAQLTEAGHLAPPPGQSAPGAATRLLREAVTRAGDQPGYHPPADLFDDLARVLATEGDYRQAYETGLLATAERNRSRLRDAENRAIAMEIQHETDRIRAEAAALSEVNASLEALGVIGREVTASLDGQAICEALLRNVRGLLDVTSFMVYRLEEGGTALRGVFGWEDEQPLELKPFPIDDPHSYVARCARSRQEIVLDHDPLAPVPNLVPGTVPTLSQLFAPMETAGRLFGVISIQSSQARAYQDRETSIFRSVCAYGAIALENARTFDDLTAAHEQIQQNQQQLLAAEKMASLGRLTAGLAHEINTPLAAVRAALDGLAKLADEYAASIDDPEVGPEDHRAIAADMGKLLTLGRTSGDRAAAFLRSIKTQTRESDSDQKIEFDPVAAARESITLLEFAVRAKGVDVRWTGADAPLALRGNPSKFAQIVTNLVTNALDAVPETGGILGFDFRTDDQNRVVMCVQDNGTGIPADLQTRIFDPLFTTKRFGEGTGLGLTIVRDLVVGAFGGEVRVHSEPGSGARFVVTLGGREGTRRIDSTPVGP